MRGSVLLLTGSLLFGAAALWADQERPDLSGTWKLDQADAGLGQVNKDFLLVIDEKAGNIHIQETRGPRPKEDVSSLTCPLTGAECPMQDGTDKAKAFVYYNGPVLVLLKTHGRKGDSVEKDRLTLSESGKSLVLEIEHLDPAAKSEKLVLSKAQ